MQVVSYKLKSIEEQFLSIEQMIPNPMIVADEAGEIVYANQLALDLFGYSDQDFMGKNLGTIIRYEFPALTESCENALCQGRKQNKVKVDLEISYRAITVNFINHWCISLRELTSAQPDDDAKSDQKDIINKLKSELDNRLKELQIFSYAVAHDLQASLRGIDGYINLFIQKYTHDFNDSGKRLLTKVTENINKLQLQLQELDYLLKLGTIELHFSEIDMYTLTNKVVENLQLSHLIDVTIKEGTWVKADSSLIQEALNRLISNAVKFSPEQTQSKIEIGCLDQGEEEHFFVKDFGVGFDDAYKDVIFDLFQQLHDPEQYPGIGMGLVTVKRIIAQHGGQVWATGIENKGATFYFSLHSTTRTNGHG